MYWAGLKHFPPRLQQYNNNKVYYASRQDGYTNEENTCGPIKTTWGKGIQAAAFTTCQVTIVTECNYCQLSGMKHDTVISDKYDL